MAGKKQLFAAISVVLDDGKSEAILSDVKEIRKLYIKKLVYDKNKYCNKWGLIFF